MTKQDYLSIIACVRCPIQIQRMGQSHCEFVIHEHGVYISVHIKVHEHITVLTMCFNAGHCIQIKEVTNLCLRLTQKKSKHIFQTCYQQDSFRRVKDGRVARSWPIFYQFDNKIAVCRSISLNWKHVTQNIIHYMIKVKRKRSNVPEQQTTLPGSIL